MLEFGAVDPKRLVVECADPDPRHRRRVRRGRARSWRSACKSLQLPVFPNELGLPDYFHERYDPLWSLISDTELPMCCHIGLNTNLDDLIARDPTPMMGVMVPMAAMSVGEALGMWMLTGVLERFQDLKVVFVEPGLGWVAWYLYIVDDMVTRQELRVPGDQGAPELVLPPEHVPHVHRGARRDPVAPPPARCREHPVVHRLPAPGVELAELARARRGAVPGVPDDERELIVSGNAARVWNL